MTIEMIPLRDLSVSPDNVRKTVDQTGIGELAASILAHGLMNPLIVIRATAPAIAEAPKPAKGKKGKKAAAIPPAEADDTPLGWHVIAGQRRLMALTVLMTDGKIPADHPVECRVTTEEQMAAELSLAENVTQLPMNVVDQFIAFAALKQPPAVTALAFGVSEKVVRQRLALGKLVPDLLEALRQGTINLAAAQALTIADRDWQQNTYLPLLAKGHYYTREPGNIRQMIVGSAIPKRYALFDLALYQGGFPRDLFADKEEIEVFADRDQFWALQNAEIAKIETALKEEGWRKVHQVDGFSQYEHVACSVPRATSADKAAIDALEAEIKGAQAAFDQADEDLEAILQDEDATDEAREAAEAATEAYSEALIDLQAKMTELVDAGRSYSKKAKASYDAYLYVNIETGQVQVFRGFITRKEHTERERAADEKRRKKEAAERKAAAEESGEAPAVPQPADLPEKPEVEPEDHKADVNRLHPEQMAAIAFDVSATLAGNVACNPRLALELLLVSMWEASSPANVMVHTNGWVPRGQDDEALSPAVKSAVACVNAALAPIGKTLDDILSVRTGNQGTALDLYHAVRALSDRELYDCIAAMVATTVGTPRHEIRAAFRVAAQDQNLAVRECWSPSPTWLAYYQKPQLAKLTQILPGEAMRSDKWSKDELIEGVMKRMTLCWKPHDASFATALREERQPNGAREVGESGEEVQAVPAAPEVAEIPAIAAE